MSKRKQPQSADDPKQLNAAFLLKFAKLNYQAKTINLEILNAFSNLLNYLTDSIAKMPQNYSPEIIKALIDIAITVQFNLHMTEDCLSTHIETVLKFLQSLFNFIDKVFIYEQKPNKDKVPQVIDLFWPLIKNQKDIQKVEVKHFEKIASVLQKIPNLPYIFEIQPQQIRIIPEQVLNEAILIAFLNDKIDFSVIFRAALSKYNQNNKVFIESFLTFFESSMNDTSNSKDNKVLFQKCLNVLMNISNAIGEKYNYIEIFFNRMIKSSNLIRNFVYGLSWKLKNGLSEGDIKIEKYYSNDHLLSISFVILEKIITFRYTTKEMSESLEIIARLSENWIDLDQQILNLNDFGTKINYDFLLKIIKFLTIENKAPIFQQEPISSLSKIFDNPALFDKQRGLLDSQEMDQKRLYEFIRQCNKIKQQGQDPEEQMFQTLSNKKIQSTKKDQNSKPNLQISIIKNFSQIIQNLSKNKIIAQKLKCQTLQQLQEILAHSFQGQVLGRNHQLTVITEVSQLMVKCLPALVSDQWMDQLLRNFLFGQHPNNPIKNQKALQIIRVIIIKKLQSQSFSKIKNDLNIDELMNKIFDVNVFEIQNLLNFHFLIFYIYLKKCSTLPDKEQAAQINSITSSVIQKLTQLIGCHSKVSQRKEEGQIKNFNKKLLVLEFLLILILDYPSGSFKLSLKKIFSTDIFKVGKKLDLYELISINQKQTASNFFNMRMRSIISQNKSQISIRPKMLAFIDQLNQISFPKNYLHTNTQTKEEKHLKIFLNIKINAIALALNKFHKIPSFIQNINIMRKVNAIDQLQILLFSFGEYIEQIDENKNNNMIQEKGSEGQLQILQDSGVIVIFNYLLKINIETGKFNERSVDQVQNDVREQIKTLQVIHISVQQTLEKMRQLIQNQNPPFDLKTLIKLLGSMKESTNPAGIAEKYSDLINEGQIIKLISELAEDPLKLKLQFSQLALITMKKLIQKDQKIRQRISELQKLKFEQKDNKMASQNQELQILEEQQNLVIVNDLSPKLKQLFLIYYPFKHQLNLINQLKVRIQSAILQMFEDPKQTSNLQTAQLESLQKIIVDDLIKSISLLKEIIIKENQQLPPQNSVNLLWNFDYQADQKFISFIIKSILKMFSANLASQTNFQLNDKIFSISAELLNNDQICKLALKQIGTDLNLQLVNMVSERVNQGCMIVKKSLEIISPRKSKKTLIQPQETENKETKDFLATSLKLYNVLKKVINFESVNSEEIIKSLIEKDQFSSIEVTKFILQQLLNISSCFIKSKSDTIADIIFGYIMQVNESYTIGKQKLHIPEFICEFFDISHVDKSNNWLNTLQKSDRNTNVCTPNPAYRCMKCDDKRLICYSCMLECHKGHPVLYLGDQKFPKCQCRQIVDDCCKLYKKNDEKDNRSLPFNGAALPFERRQIIRSSRHQFLMGGDEDRAYDSLGMHDEEQYNQLYRFGGGRIRRPRQFDELERQQIFALDPSFERIERLDNNPFGGPQLFRQQKRVQDNQNKSSEENFLFEDQVYQSTQKFIDIQKLQSSQNNSQIISQSYYLPVFLQMFNEIYSGNQEKSTQKINYQMQRIGFDSLISGKIMHQSWRATNANTYNVRIRRDNPLNNKSAAVSKQIITQNQKFVVVASANMLHVHSKEKYLQQLLEMKPTQAIQSVNQFNGNFDIHTLDFSPLDDFTFVAAGLHIIVLMQLTGEGIISRNNTQHLRISVNNDYINKVRASKLGIFYSTSYEIKLLNWSFKPMLTIKSSAECLLKEWCLYEKRTGCTVYCVTAHGYTEFIDVNPSDEGKKFFTHKVNDGRKTIETGANILVKDVEKVGKVYIGSFKDKDGTNLIANLVGDSTENPSYIPLRNNYIDIFGKKYLIGQAEIVKGGQNQMFIVCTIREPITPEISIHQGQLVVYKIRKDRKCQFNLINTDNKCEHFCVVPMGNDNWSIISMHDDGSLHFTVLNKPQKSSIDQQCKRLRDIQPTNSDQNKEKYSQIKQSIKKMISPDLFDAVQLHPLNYFREFSDLLKSSLDIKVKKTGNDYEITLLNPTKLITGFTLPFVGNVIFPQRTVKRSVQVGLSNLEILYYFTEGTLKFKVQKIQEYKSGMDNMNQKFRQKLQRLERLNEIAMDSERATQIMNSIKQAQAMNDQIDFYGTTIDSFKNRIPNFGQIFNEEQSSESKDKDVQKMGILLKIFIEHSIKEQNYLCEPFEIQEFVKNLRKMTLTITKPETYKIIKELIVVTLKMYENMSETRYHVFNDEFYPLKYATQQKIDLYYEMLKGQIGENQVQEVIDAFCSISEDDLQLGLLYLSKYPSLLAKIQKKTKKVDKVDPTVTKLMKLYVLGYQVLKYKNHNCQWILGALCSIFAAQPKSKELRQSFYQTLSSYTSLKLQAWLKNVPEVDGQQNVSDVNIINKPPPARQQNLGGENNLSAIYSQFGMGEMDEEAMLRMAIEMSEMQFKQNQEHNFNFGANQNEINPIEEEKQNFDDEGLMDQQFHHSPIREEKKRTILMDLVEHCTSKLNDPSDLAVPKIILLYVVSKYVNETENHEVFTEILERISRILGQLNANCDNFDKHVLMAYFSVFSNILTTSNILKKKSLEEAEELCLVIKEIVMHKLESVKPEKVSKLKTPPNLLGKIFKGEKLYTFAHYAYGLASLLLPPCQPEPILLSLQCYWLLPESKEHYTRMKNMTTIREGITTGNIEKIYEVATQYPQIWRECNDVAWLESWILERKNNWQKALSLLALHYDADSKEENKKSCV